MSFYTPIHTNEQSIERVLNTGLPVMLVFWRKDCAPCAQLNPVLDQLARAYAGKTLIAKVDTSDNPGLVRRYDVERVPGLIVVQDGRVRSRATGAASEASLRSWLDALLAGNARATTPDGPSVALNGTSHNRPAQGTASPHGGAGRGAPGSHNGPRPQPAAGGHAPGAAPVVLTDATFDQVIAGNAQPALIDFWAPWCGPCRMLAPAVEQLAQEFAGRAVVGKLNIDDYPRIADRYGIRSIPAIYIFRGGKVLDRMVGVQPAPVLRQALQKHLR